MPSRKKIGLWAWARSLTSTPRYYGATGDDPDKTELLTIPSQQSVASASKVETRETGPINDLTLATPFLEEAVTSSISNSSANAAEDNSVYLCANATVGLLLLNTVLISVAGGLASKYTGSGGSSNSKVVYEGSCVITSRWNTAFHFIINVISTCILAASNYCMQTLVAPTRDEIDLFHAKRRWLDIGGSSFRNLFAIPLSRLGLWLILLITATPFHLLYNSNCFRADVTSGSNDINSAKSMDWDQIIHIVMGERSEKISPEQCSRYTGTSSYYPSGYKGLIYLASDLAMEDGGDIAVLRSTGTSRTQSVYAASFTNPNPSTTTSDECAGPLSRSTTHSLSGCLAFEGKKNCQLLLNPPIAVIISLATLMKVVAMFLAAHLQRTRAPPLLTTGDAVASFLERPDDTTKGMCWASRRCIEKGNWRPSSVLSTGQPPSREYRYLSPPRQWRKASSPSHWAVTSIITANFAYGNYSEMEGVVIANSVQLIVTVGYYFYNSVLTSMLASAEYSSYGADRKALRVTWPAKGSQQRSTYWLSVHYKYGIPVIILFMANHWFVSQGFYYVLMIPYGTDGQPLYGNKVSSVGASALPVFIAALVGVFLFLFLLSLAFRRLKSTIPLAGSCSAAISAACHPPEDVCTATVAHGELFWGETTGLPPDWVDDQSDGCDLPKGHCSFTPLDARLPSLDKLYS
ncbi:hypothetical protein BDV36DRAFT_308758 [Aspergillus pseudocaelatus]|uniref:DUF6536 domain-containing protein n=1 Tax=Aspergillus pseudocaelatus TaxID=1825620 RepID=A0ABQ6WMQ1_9EURO|nr:hypothetical protein BDV36DRAFT_308758 [Aspergillus pseudocaelatus]